MDHATVRLLKERFDLVGGEAEHILGSFLDAVERSLEEYGICHVTGIGSFVRAPGDTRISFEPADALTRAVNARFADLPVYEIDTADVSAMTSQEPADGTSSDPHMTVPTREGAAVPPGMPDPPKSKPEPVESRLSSDAEKTTSGRDLVGDGPSTAPAGELDTPSDSSAADDRGPAAAPTDDDDEPAAAPTRPSPAKSRSPRRRTEKTSGGFRAAWIVLPAILVLAAAAIWVMSRPAGPESESDTLASRSTPAAQTPAAVAEGNVEDNGSDAAGGETELPGETGLTGANQAAGEAQTSGEDQGAEDQAGERPTSSGSVNEPAGVEAAGDYPLDRTVDGYTMIVASSPDRTAADEQISRFTELDLPFGVLDYSEEDPPIYRLAVGLFDSAQQADSARQAMADTLPSGTWVWRIR